MKTRMMLVALMAMSVGGVLSSCSKKKLTPVCDGTQPTYDNGVATIISGTCMGSKCHSSGSKNGDLTTYAKMKTYLTNGAFNKQVMETQNMPKGSSLSQAQLNTLQCWVENGYPEK
ncbi:MAG: hypothetical protein H6546_08365 [Chitinophagales bacterium]|nr:hypothetical protein [Flavobacteriales bacterium]MCB9020330.1 hypothetical protein [Chitinophagales bacterium]